MKHLIDKKHFSRPLGFVTINKILPSADTAYRMETWGQQK